MTSMKIKDKILAEQSRVEQSRAAIILILLTVLIVICIKFSIHKKWQSNQIHKLESQLSDSWIEKA